MSKQTDKSSFEKYNWNDLPREIVRQGVTRCGFAGDHVLMVMNWLEPGMKVNPHRHPFEQIVYIVSGTALFHIGDDVVTAGPGDVIAYRLTSCTTRSRPERKPCSISMFSRRSATTTGISRPISRKTSGALIAVFS